MGNPSPQQLASMVAIQFQQRWLSYTGLVGKQAKSRGVKPPTTWMGVDLSMEPVATLGLAKQTHLSHPLLPYCSLAD